MFQQYENNTMEWKLEYTPNIKKEIVAFLNTNGGTILIGKDDDGNVVGVRNAKVIVEAVSSMIHEAIKPDASLLCSAQEYLEDGKELVRLEIGRGTKKPYYIAEKGMKPSGVYVRINNTSQPASEYAIKQMIVESDEREYEQMESVNQDLTFDYLKFAFSNAQVELKMKTLRLVNENNRYTNLALLLSDQCPFSIKAAIFDSDDKSQFIDRKEFCGSLVKQADEAFAYLVLNNKNRGAYNGLVREDKMDYNNLVLREGLLNAIIHRDYSLNGSILISIYNNRIEYISIGGLVSGMTYNDMLLGVSRTRNEYLANVFFMLKYVEAYGTGIEKIQGNYEHTGLSPIFEISDHGFLLMLPNKNNIIKTPIVSEIQQILDYIIENGPVTRAQIQEKFNLKLTKTRNLLIELLKWEKISVHGNGKNTKYTIK